MNDSSLRSASIQLRSGPQRTLAIYTYRHWTWNVFAPALAMERRICHPSSSTGPAVHRHLVPSRSRWGQDISKKVNWCKLIKSFSPKFFQQENRRLLWENRTTRLLGDKIQLAYEDWKTLCTCTLTTPPTAKELQSLSQECLNFDFRLIEAAKRYLGQHPVYTTF